MCVHVCEGEHSCCVVVLQFSVLILVRVGCVVSLRRPLLALFFAGAEGTSLLGGRMSLGFRIAAGAGETQEIEVAAFLGR